jgi:proline iminopeptidase
VVYYDQRGCGRSAEPAEAGAFTMDHLVADLEALRVELGLDRIALLGQSFGGRIAATYATVHPDRVDRLVLHASPITGPLRPNAWSLRPAMIDTVLGPRSRQRLRAQLAGLTDQAERFAAAHRALDGDPAARARFLCHDPAKAPALLRILDEAERLGNARMGPALRLTGADDLTDALAEPDVPTLVVVGLADRSVGVDACRDLADRLPRGQLHLLTSSGHFPEHEQPEDYVEAVRAFLGR